MHLEVVVTLESSLLSNDVIFAKAIHEFSGSIHYLLLLLPFVVQFYRDFIATQGQFFHRTKGGTWWFQLWEQREKEKKRGRENRKLFFSVAGKSFAPYNYLKLAVILFPTILSLQFFIQLLLIIF